MYVISLDCVNMHFWQGLPLALILDPLGDDLNIEAVCDIAKSVDVEIAVTMLIQQLVGDCFVYLDIIGEDRLQNVGGTAVVGNVPISTR